MKKLKVGEWLSNVPEIDAPGSLEDLLGLESYQRIAMVLNGYEVYEYSHFHCMKVIQGFVIATGHFEGGYESDSSMRYYSEKELLKIFDRLVDSVKEELKEEPDFENAWYNLTVADFL